MRFLIAIIVALSAISCVEHIGYDEITGELSWTAGEITVTLDSSLETLGDADTVYSMVEDAFLTWADYTGHDVNFVYSDCTDETQNCVYVTQLEEGLLGYCEGNMHGDTILRADIMISDKRDLDDKALWHLLLHETGHFFGLPGSADTATIMYDVISGTITDLTQRDIAEIQEHYR